MTARIRPLLIASVLALTIAAPAAAATKVQDLSTSCSTDPIDGLTYCTNTDVEIRTTESDSGLVRVKLTGTTFATTTDAAGNVLVAHEISIREQDTYWITADGPIYKKVNVRGTTETTEGDVVVCLSWRVVSSNGETHVDEVSSTAGPC